MKLKSDPRRGSVVQREAGGSEGKNLWCLLEKRSRIARILRFSATREPSSRMSDLPSSRTLTPNTSQLPVSWYFDPQVFELEQKRLFASGPGYVGHELMVPNQGDYHTLAWMDHGKVLVRNAGGIELLSNVCRHRQAILLEGRGNAQNIVCPLHRWTYDLKGELLGAPRFESQPCVKLASTPLKNWNGLLFAGPRDPRKDLAKVTTMADWDFSGYVLDSARVDEYHINWKTFVE